MNSLSRHQRIPRFIPTWPFPSSLGYVWLRVIILRRQLKIVYQDSLQIEAWYCTRAACAQRSHPISALVAPFFFFFFFFSPERSRCWKMSCRWRHNAVEAWSVWINPNTVWVELQHPSTLLLFELDTVLPLDDDGQSRSPQRQRWLLRCCAVLGMHRYHNP